MYEDAELEALLDQDSCQTQKEFALGVTQQTISYRFEIIGNDSKARELGSIWTEAEKHWTPIFHMWNAACINERVFLHHIVTDEKWIHYDNPKKRKSWRSPGHVSTSTTEYSWKKTHVVYLGSAWCRVLWVAQTERDLLRLSTEHNWWDWAEHSRKNAPTTPGMTKLFSCMIVFDAVAAPVKSYLEILKWKVLPHLPYSPDIAPSDYH